MWRRSPFGGVCQLAARRGGPSLHVQITSRAGAIDASEHASMVAGPNQDPGSNIKRELLEEMQQQTQQLEQKVQQLLLAAKRQGGDKRPNARSEGGRVAGAEPEAARGA